MSDTEIELPKPSRVIGDLEIYDFEQNSPEWEIVRAGKITASEIKSIMAKSKDMKMRTTYLRKLCAEIIAGKPLEGYTNKNMERGHEMEAEARSFYEFMTNRKCVPVGFIYNTRLGVGCSPDSLVGEDRVSETKTKFPHLLIECIERGSCPPEHAKQVQGLLWVTGRKICDLNVYWPGLPQFLAEVPRDEDEIANIAAEVKTFKADLDALVARVRKYAP